MAISLSPLRDVSALLSLSVALSMSSALGGMEKPNLLNQKEKCALLIQPGDDPESTLHAFALSRGAILEKSVLLADSPVKNQKKYGCCWISSAHGLYERETQKRFGRVIPLSDNYHVLMSLFYRVEEAVFFGTDLSEGGWSFAADWMARNIGLVPESAWTPKINFLAGEGDAMIADIENRITSLRRILTQMKEKGASAEEAWEIASNARSEFFSILRNQVGNPPSRFTVDGKSYTPHAFAQELLPKDKDISIVSIHPDRPELKKSSSQQKTQGVALLNLFPETINFLPKSSNKISPSTGKYDPVLHTLYARSNRIPHHASLKRSLEDTHLTVIGALQEGRPVYISTPMMKEFYDKTTGVMSISAKGVSIEEARKAPIGGGHAMLITGAYVDAAQSLVGYRIQNSWGADVGVNGYFFMDKDYFDTFVRTVRVQLMLEAEEKLPKLKKPASPPA